MWVHTSSCCSGGGGGAVTSAKRTDARPGEWLRELRPLERSADGGVRDSCGVGVSSGYRPMRRTPSRYMVTRFAASPRTDNSPQRKEARPLSHALTSD
jgi:hypothetical protein